MAEFLDSEEIRQAILHGDGSGLLIGIVDSGVWFGDSRLAKAEQGSCYSYIRERKSKSADPEGDRAAHDPLGHGTDIAAIIHHYVPKARLSSYRVFGGRAESKFHVIGQAISDAVDDGCQLINCSVGTRPSQVFSQNDNSRLMNYKSSLDRAYLAGVHVIAAGSNARISIEEWPAFFTSVLGVRVAEVAANGLSYFPHHMLAFGARGENRVEGFVGPENLGTSFATARVTGLLARLLSVQPRLSPAMAAEALALYARG